MYTSIALCRITTFVARMLVKRMNYVLCIIRTALKKIIECCITKLVWWKPEEVLQCG